VAKDLVDYQFVKTAMERHKGWETAPGVDIEHPFTREEIIAV
jgi:NitT/TauT family transport system substrate-binding protein